jgi:SAM-dependent methyltransferase
VPARDGLGCIGALTGDGHGGLLRVPSHCPERAAADGLAQRCNAVAADGSVLPFRDASFDALSHSDVLCCTPDKLGVLRACRRVARDGATMVFTTIAIAPSLAEAERRIAVESGPKFVDVEDDYGVLLGRSGLCLQERTDLTAARIIHACGTYGMQAVPGALAEVFGSDEFTEQHETPTSHDHCARLQIPAARAFRCRPGR